MLLPNNIKSIPSHQNILNHWSWVSEFVVPCKTFIIWTEPTIILFPIFKLKIINVLNLKTVLPGLTSKSSFPTSNDTNPVTRQQIVQFYISQVFFCFITYFFYYWFCIIIIINRNWNYYIIYFYFYSFLNISSKISSGYFFISSLFFVKLYCRYPNSSFIIFIFLLLISSSIILLSHLWLINLSLSYIIDLEYPPMFVAESPIYVVLFEKQTTEGIDLLPFPWFYNILILLLSFIIPTHDVVVPKSTPIFKHDVSKNLSDFSSLFSESWLISILILISLSFLLLNLALTFKIELYSRIFEILIFFLYLLNSEFLSKFIFWYISTISFIYIYS